MDRFNITYDEKHHRVWCVCGFTRKVRDSFDADFVIDEHEAAHMAVTGRVLP